MRKQMLVVDDYPEALEISKEMLELQGYEVHTALCGPDAEAVVFAADVSVVIIDDDPMGLPAQRLLKRLREIVSVAGKHPFCAIALRGDLVFKDIALAEFDFTLNKPLNFDQLDLLVAQCIERSERQ